MNFFRLDTHVHTRESSICGRTKGKIVADLYKKAGYDGIVITDHYCKAYFLKFAKNTPWEDKIEHFLQGYYHVLEEGSKIGLKVMLGIEIKFTESPREFLIYGIDETFLKTYPELYNLGIANFKQLTEEVATSYEILIFQAHPFRPGVTPVSPELIDGIEVYNGNPRHNSHNDLALAFAKKHTLLNISGSDFHRINDLGRGGIILPQEINSSQELVSFFKEKNEEIKLITTLYTPFSILRFFTILFNQIRNLIRIKKPTSSTKCDPSD